MRWDDLQKPEVYLPLLFGFLLFLLIFFLVTAFLTRHKRSQAELPKINQKRWLIETGAGFAVLYGGYWLWGPDIMNCIVLVIATVCAILIRRGTIEPAFMSIHPVAKRRMLCLGFLLGELIAMPIAFKLASWICPPIDSDLSFVQGRIEFLGYFAAGLNGGGFVGGLTAAVFYSIKGGTSHSWPE